jgi:hypothetical protein
MSSTAVRALPAIQGLFHLATGIWPLVSIRTFQWVTGLKTDHLPTGREADHWLVNIVAVQMIAISVTLLLAAWRNESGVSLAWQAIGAPIGLAEIDLVYVAREVIAPIYLLDAVIEGVLLIAWLVVLMIHWRSLGANHG